MRIWIVTVGEPLPTDGQDVRLYRSGIMSNLLARSEHDVTWWTSTFDHIARRQRSVANTTVVVSDNLRIRFIETPGYRRSVSLARIWSHAICARNFRRMMKTVDRPDIILVSYPTIELSYVATSFGEAIGVPVVVDVRDLWPDLFTEAFPAILRPASKWILYPYERMAFAALNNATEIVGITDQFVEWGYRKARRRLPEKPRSFAMAYEAQNLSDDEMAQAVSFWRSRGLSPDDWIACFFGTLGRQFELEAVIEAAAILGSQGAPIKFVICGSGDNEERYRELAAGLQNIDFPGWVGRKQIQGLMAISTIGLAPYRSTTNFLLNIPNKPIEYLSRGLPIFSTIGGALGQMINENGVGIVCTDPSPASIASELERLSRDSGRIESMRRCGMELFERRYRADTVYSDFGAFLERLANR